MKDNEFIRDWLYMPLSKPDIPFEKMDGKKLFILGQDNQLAEWIGQSFRCIAQKKQLGLMVKVCEPEELETQRGECVYIVDVSMCHATLSEMDQMTVRAWLERIRKQLSIVNVQRMVFLSDYRVFGTKECAQSCSEHELRFVDGDAEAEIMRFYENEALAFTESSGVSAVVLRTATLYAPGLEWKGNLLHDMARKIASGEQLTMHHSSGRYSCSYMGDFFSALWLALLKCPEHDTFQVSSTEAFQLEELAAWLYAFYPEQANICYVEHEQWREYVNQVLVRLAAAMNHGRLSLYGYRSQVPLKKGITMLVWACSERKDAYYFDDAYQGKLKTVQALLLTQLLEIDRICKKHQIQYFLAGGTLLGAVRHQGFIPWDDDVDVMMLRPDYEHFCRVVQQELPDNMFFQTPETDAKSHYLFGKLRLNDTLLMTGFGAQFPDMHNGVFADIVVQDRTAGTRLGQRLHIYVTHKLRKLAMDKWKSTAGVQIPSKGPRKKLRGFLMRHISFRTLERMRYHVMTRYENKNTGYLYDGAGRNIERGAFPEQWLLEHVDMPFEGYMLPVPKEYDLYLTYLYGDYMELIPVSRREVSHEMAVIDLGRYADHTCGKGVRHE